jgi:hypothetical protein
MPGHHSVQAIDETTHITEPGHVGLNIHRTFRCEHYRAIHPEQFDLLSTSLHAWDSAIIQSTMRGHGLEGIPYTKKADLNTIPFSGNHNRIIHCIGRRVRNDCAITRAPSQDHVKRS